MIIRKPFTKPIPYAQSDGKRLKPMLAYRLTECPNNGYEQSGIYMVCCAASNNAYVGASTNLAHRAADHRHYFLNFQVSSAKVHLKPPQIAIQDLEEHGPQSFYFVILEICGVDVMTAREEFWFNAIHQDGNTGYNGAKFRPYVYSSRPLMRPINRWRSEAAWCSDRLIPND